MPAQEPGKSRPSARASARAIEPACRVTGDGLDRSMRAAIERVQFRPRVLVDVSKRTTDTTFFSKRVSMPLAVRY